MNRQQLKHSVWLAVAREQARLATCCRLAVGCVLLRADGSVAGTGYNGSLPGKPHCTPETCNPSQRCYRTRHAERSALDYSTGDIATAYVTHEPCIRCTQDLIARGCRAVYFLEPYAAKDEAENEAKRRHIEEAGLKWRHALSDGDYVAECIVCGEREGSQLYLHGFNYVCRAHERLIQVLGRVAGP